MLLPTDPPRYRRDGRKPVEDIKNSCCQCTCHQVHSKTPPREPTGSSSQDGLLVWSLGILCGSAFPSRRGRWSDATLTSVSRRYSCNKLQPSEQSNDLSPPIPFYTPSRLDKGKGIDTTSKDGQGATDPVKLGTKPPEPTLGSARLERYSSQPLHIRSPLT